LRFAAPAPRAIDFYIAEDAADAYAYHVATPDENIERR